MICSMGEHLSKNGYDFGSIPMLLIEYGIM